MDACKERHKNVDGRIGVNTTKITELDSRVDRLEQFRSSTETEMKNLVEQIKSLVGTLQWAMTSTIVLLVGFFLWYIQSIPR